MTIIPAIQLAAEVDAALARIQESLAFLATIASVTEDQYGDARDHSDDAVVDAEFWVARECNTAVRGMIQRAEDSRTWLADKKVRLEATIARRAEFSPA